MKTMPASEARQSFAELIDAAAREPVVIRRQQRGVAVVVSMQEYERLTQLNPVPSSSVSAMWSASAPRPPA